MVWGILTQKRSYLLDKWLKNTIIYKSLVIFHFQECAHISQ